MKAAQWHALRRKKIMTNSIMRTQLKEIPKKDPLVIVFVILFPIAIFISAAFAAQLSWLGVFVLSATVGAYLLFGAFHFGHEICHQATFYCKSQKSRNAWLIYLNSMFFGGAFYNYYRWNHLNHHSRHATDPLFSLRDQSAAPTNYDADVYGLMPYLEMANRPNEKQTFIVPGNNPVVRKILLAILPALDIFWQSVSFSILSPLGVKLRLWITRNDHTLTAPAKPHPKWLLLMTALDMGDDRHIKYRKELSDYSASLLISALRWVTVLSVCYLLLGVKAIAFIFLSQAFCRGFLFHPYFTFWQSIHADPEFTQGTESQPTVSTYGRFTDFIMFNLNRHTEHHDFPHVPGRYLNRITEIHPDLYHHAIFSYSGMREMYRTFFKTQGTWVYRIKTA